MNLLLSEQNEFPASEFCNVLEYNFHETAEYLNTKRKPFNFRIVSSLILVLNIL